MTESSSTALHFVDDDAVPAAPAPSGGGQYDNNSNYGGRRNMYSHLAFEVGGGFNAPTEDSSPYISWGGNVTVGAGYRFNPMLSMMAEYQFIDSKLPGMIIDEAGATGGNVHIWSLTLDPVIDLVPKGKTDVYITGGGGFYRKVTNFTDPQQVQYCDYFYCGIATQNVVVGHFSSNQPGWNIGMGLAHRMGPSMKLFAEARYTDVMSPAVTTQPNGLGTTTVGADTIIIPVTVGLRW